MKNVCIIFLLSIIISLTAFGLRSEKKGDFSFNAYMGGSFLQKSVDFGEYLRVHIRADSNDGAAQAVKYYVRDAVVDYLTPFVATYQTEQDAYQGIQSRLQEIAQVATSVLRGQGFDYGATAELKKEEFPTRVYQDYTLPAGEYTALIICLGSGAGDNWWCVVYPPLCFAGESNTFVIYKSKILEIIENWKKRSME